ncbi:MAG: outer membrane protein OmpK [Cetobacterium sp.]|uniref:outer membrane protein OmpK n=1 Tax=unclassified Cetobacterium TaxID=2630983 RepID=UPI00163CB6F7|nr:outer membrane protein OmpK [Cetobacterium sp. 2A]MBC2855711.1 hypothetical protein [Cetobacterium sp. 2A]
MKTKFLIGAFALLSTVSFAKYEPYNFNMLGLSIYKGHNQPDAFGAAGRDSYLEVEGANRYKLLDLYWFLDRNDIFKDPKSSKYNNSETVFVKINPRISIDGLINKDLSIGPINEWFLSYTYKGTNGNHGRLDYHYVGLGVDLNVPKMDFFKANLYSKYNNKNFGAHENQWDGYTVAISYGATIHDFQNGFKLTFGGWGDYDFDLKTSERGENAKKTALALNNQVRLSYNNFGVSYTYQINDNFTGRNQANSDENNHSYGVHYTINF